jgi:hypothetical protein
VHHELEQIQPVHVDLEAEPERLERLNLLRDDLVQAGRVRPELLVAERVVPEDLSALTLGVAADPRRRELPTPRRAEDRDRERDQSDRQAPRPDHLPDSESRVHMWASPIAVPAIGGNAACMRASGDGEDSEVISARTTP